MNDSPTQPSILMRKPVICTHGSAPLNCFFVTGTTLMMPGFSATARDPLMGERAVGIPVIPAPPPRPPMPKPGVRPRLPLITTPFDVLMSMPQPIW